MKANWSLVLNVFLLFGVVYSIFRLLRIRKKTSMFSLGTPSIGDMEMEVDSGISDIISVRKLDDEEIERLPVINPDSAWGSRSTISEDFNSYKEIKSNDKPNQDTKIQFDETQEQPLMMFLLAKENQQLAGYELLQAVLAAGFRFGEGDLFHRHQHANGQGTIMCSLAAATDKGTFDLQNMGSFSARGLCLYMHLSGNSNIDEERFEIMFDTAKALSEDLDAHLLDDKKQPLSDTSINRYYKSINILEDELLA